MANIISDNVSGTLELTGLPDRMAVASWEDFLKKIPDLYSVQIPRSITGVLFQSDPPSESERDKLWVRRDRSGNIVGLFLFDTGHWRPFYNLPPEQVVWTYGDSQNVRPGFQLIEDGDTRIDEATVQGIVGKYLPNGSGGYSYFAVRYIGFEQEE